MVYGNDSQPVDLHHMSATLRRWVLEQSYEARVGHIGSALSVVELLAALWGAVLHAPGTDDFDRDRFILTKGHAALALYAALRYRGLIDEVQPSTRTVRTARCFGVRIPNRVYGGGRNVGTEFPGTRVVRGLWPGHGPETPRGAGAGVRPVK